MKITISDLKNYILSIGIAIHDKPVFTIQENLETYPEIIKAKLYLGNVYIKAPNKRGNCKVDIDLPSELKTKYLNNAVRYGYKFIRGLGSVRNPNPNALDQALAIAMANKISPVKE